MIRRCTAADVDRMLAIINDGAQAYRGAIPEDCWHEPYMTRDQLLGEIAAGVEFWGYEDSARLVGVMGLQMAGDVALIRHAYVLKSEQARGVGGDLLRSLLSRTDVPVLVGTWADATWAIAFYQRHGFRLLSRDETARLLQRYWTIGARQRDVSVVLERTS